MPKSNSIASSCARSTTLKTCPYCLNKREVLKNHLMRHVKGRHPLAYAKISSWQAANPGKRIKLLTDVCAPIEGDTKDVDSVFDMSEDVDQQANAQVAKKIEVLDDVEVEGSAIKYMHSDIDERKPAQISKPLVPMAKQQEEIENINTDVNIVGITVSAMFGNTANVLEAPTVSVEETRTFVLNYDSVPAAASNLFMHLTNYSSPRVLPVVYQTQHSKMLNDLLLIDTAMLSQEKMQNVVLAALVFKDANIGGKVIARAFKECPMAAAAKKSNGFKQQLAGFFGNTDVATWFLERAHAIDEQSLLTMRILVKYKFDAPLRVM